MKGIVFTEFLEMVEKEFGYEVVDQISSLPELHDGAAYTAVGNYPHGDMLAMVETLSQSVGRSPKDLVYTFGRYLFTTFSREYPAFFKDVDGCLNFLQDIESVIHNEVHKLDPAAHRPSFDCNFDSDGALVMDYYSQRPMADLGEGLIVECINYFKEDLKVVRQAGSTGDARSARFIIMKNL
jgi:hypothetical protein